MVMRKFISVIVCVVFSFSVVYAVENTQAVSFRAVVPEDYGVVVPKDAFKVDKLVFETSNGDLMPGIGLENIILEEGQTMIPIDILFYGNTENPYRVEIAASTDGWLLSKDGTESIPVSLAFSDYLGSDGIVSSVNDDGTLTLTVPAIGARHGDKAGELAIYWESLPNIMPGEYDMNIDFALRSVV